MNKNIYVLFLFFMVSFSFGQHKPIQNRNNFKPEDLKGFDANTAWQKAKGKTQNPRGQKEVFESMRKRYAQEHQALSNKNTPVIPLTTSNLRSGANNFVYNSYCPNVGFENMNFSNWVGGTWSNSTYSDWPTVTPTWSIGIVTLGTNTPAQAYYNSFVSPTPNRATLMTIPPTVNNPPNTTIGWDSIAINPVTHLSDIPFISPTGNGASVRLGNANTGAETEEMSYSMAVSAQNSQFTFSYALVLNSGGHLPSEQPFFQVNIFDQAGNPIPGCGSYQVDASGAATDPSFHAAVYFDTFSNQWEVPFDTTYYKKWTLVGVDLTAYIGQTVTITFRTADCSLGGHYGYAYIDASCSPVQAIVNMCAGLTVQQVIAPSGYVTYQWYGPNSSTNPVPAPGGTSDTLTINNGNTGDIYYLDATSANGCVTHLQAILQNSQVGILAVNSTPSCIGGSSGTANVIATGDPLGAYNYNWVNSTGQTVGNTQEVTGLSPGTYTVHVTSANCGAHDSSVTVLPAPPYMQSQIANFCGNATYLTVPAGSTNIHWYGPGGTSIPPPQGTNDTLLAQGTVNNQVYSVTYVNSGCVDSLVITLTQIPGGTLSHSNITEICVGATNGQATINLNTTASPPYSYSITGPGFNNSFPNTSNTSIPLTGLAYGNYTVSAFDGTCFYSDNFEIDTIPVPVSIMVSPLTLCSSDSSVMTFSFSSAPPTQCQVSTMPVCATPQLYTCGPSNAVTPSSFQYPTPYGNYYTKMRAQYIYTASELNTAGITAGNLTSIAFNITNLNGTITSYPNFNISIGCSGQSTFTSFSDQTSLITGLTNVYSNSSVNITTGINTYNFSQPYSWDGTSNIIIDICFEVPGTYSYTTNAQVSCTSTSNYSSLTITSDTDPTCVISSTPIGFYGSDPEQMRPVATFGWCSAVATPSMYNYNLNPNTGIIGGSINTPTTGLQPASTTHYTLTTTSIYGNCTKKDTFTIFVTAPFSIHMPNPDTLLCNDNPVINLNPIFTNNSTGNATQEPATWNIHNNAPGITNINAFGLATFNPQIADTGKQYLVITAGGNCQAKDSILFKVYPFKSAKITVIDSIFCFNDPGTQIHAISTGGLWSGPGISSSGFFSPQIAGVTNPFVLIKHITNKGTPCADSSTAQMTVISTPTVNFVADTTQGCSPITSIWFSSNVSPLPANGSYMWYFGDGHISSTQNTNHVYAQAGTYSPKLVYTDVNGCKDSLIQTGYIIVHPKPHADFYATPATTDILSPHVDFINTSTPNNCSWAWNIAGTDTSALKNTSKNFDVAGTYVIVLYATNQYNCKDSSVVNLIVNGAYSLYVPSSFTPNNDGLNDVFKPQGFGLAENGSGYKMEIYNRWGQRLFETTDINTGWTGSNNGVVLTEDVYVYNIIYKDYQNETHSLKGTVTLIK